LNRHNNEVHEQRLQIKIKVKKCAQCGFVTYHTGHLNDHIKSAHKKLNNDDVCPNIEFASSSKSAVRRHVLQPHKKVDLGVVVFEKEVQAEDNFLLKEKLEASEHFEDLDLGAHKCQECNYNAEDQMSLISHVTTAHLKVKLDAIPLKSGQKADDINLKLIQNVSSFEVDMTRKASHLNSSFHEAVNDAEHCNSFDMQTVPNQVLVMIGDHKCVQCNYATAHQKDLEKHVKAEHYKIGNHQCNKCKFTTPRKNNLLVHVKSVHDQIKEHKCTLCDYASARKNTLKIHVKNVHDMIRDQLYTHCDYKTSQKTYLNLHVKSVYCRERDNVASKLAASSEMCIIHKCVQCNYATANQKDLKKHVKAEHHKIGNHKCNHCEYTTPKRHN
jgi:hypothetical protein